MMCYGFFHLSRHVIFAPSSVNSYASATFPGLSDAIFNALHTASPDWDEVRRQADAVRVHIRYAAAAWHRVPYINFDRSTALLEIHARIKFYIKSKPYVRNYSLD